MTCRVDDNTDSDSDGDRHTSAILVGQALRGFNSSSVTLKNAGMRLLTWALSMDVVLTVSRHTTPSSLRTGMSP